MPDPLSLDSIASTWLEAFQDACSSVSSAEAAVAFFLPNGFLRDRLCLSRDFRTLEGSNQISSFLASDQRLSKAKLTQFTIERDTSLGGPILTHIPAVPGISPSEVIQFTCRFRIGFPAAIGRGLIRLAQEVDDETQGLSSSHWKAFMVYLVLEDFVGFEEPVDTPLGHYDDHTKTWDEVHAERLFEVEHDPTVLVVGAGQCGLVAAVRLQRLGIKVLVVEKTAHVGDIWRNRYDILTLHVRLFSYFSSLI